MEWTLARVGAWCGLCDQRIEPGARIALVTTHKKIRCEACAAAVPIILPPAPVALEDDDDLPLTPEADADGR